VSVEDEILACLSDDSAIAALLGPGDKIMLGSRNRKLPTAAPFLLIELLRGAPALEGLEGVIADVWDCGITIAVEGSGASLASCVTAAMESLGFEHRQCKTISAGNPGLCMLEVKYSGERMR
jgi:hypothetical protein